MVGDQYFVVISTPNAVSATVGTSLTAMTPIDQVPDVLRLLHGLDTVGGFTATHVWLGNVGPGPLGVRDVEITIVESGGISRTLSTRLNVVGIRSNRNYFLLPGTNYVGLGQIPDESALDALFAQPVPNANPAFEQALGRPVTLADVVEKVFAFSDDGSFLTYNTPPDPFDVDAGPADTLTDLAPYRGMISWPGTVLIQTVLGHSHLSTCSITSR